jgi:hypothetical protein
VKLRSVEQRRTPRVAIELRVDVTARDSGEKVSGVARDISLGGMFIEAALQPPFGSAVLVGFSLPGEPEPMLLPGTVRWTRAGAMGVQFGLLGARETFVITQTEGGAAREEVIGGDRLDAELLRSSIDPGIHGGLAQGVGSRPEST